MKTAIFTFLGLGLLLSSVSNACPVFEIARIRVVNEQGVPLNNAKVYSLYSPKDSVALRHHVIDFVDNQIVLDSGTFGIWSSYRQFFGKSEGRDYRFRICAEGYSDVVLGAIEFKMNLENRRIPILEVVMYTQRMVKQNQSYFKVDLYKAPDLVVNDSLRIGMMEYKKNMNLEATASQNNLNEQVSAVAYPNPAKEKLNIHLNYAPSGTHRIVLHDAAGRKVFEESFQLENYEVALSWYKPGTYFITVYDPIETVVLRQQIIHQ
ncbi:MAG: T9SS type A sorting domain-containing protein [Bacteroidota bacterium]|nr:T9SS type A sorting domain-containing protein [Bacteroidota bacterium]MDX5430178.1 T9SS type A sorting domain-containing protein [Bacteroidota bacterium]MDX5468941.1 T9SS type A sorting domain-containing protein [Bacteroidota bacterium]